MKSDNSINILAQKIVFDHDGGIRNKFNNATGNDHIMNRHIFHTFLLLLSLTVTDLYSMAFAAPRSTPATNIEKEATLLAKVTAHITNGCFVMERGSNKPLSYNGTQLFTPASIWKLATAATALFTLGEEYRFKTEFYQDDAGNLYIKGYGDPFLVSEEVDLIVKELTTRIILPIKAIFIDQSAFALEPDVAKWQTNSDNPYDAQNYGTAVNFNTIHISTSPKGITSSAEPQTPSLAIMQRLAQHLMPGTHRINISQDKGNVNEYTRELFLAKTGDHLPKPVARIKREKPLPPDAKKIYRHYSSKKLPEIIKAMLLYSNNFIANQLFLISGAVRYGFPANWQKARMVAKDFLRDEIGLDEKEFKITEGSGLARSNMISGRAMLQIVHYLKAYASLLPEKKHSLIKSGTMSGVYSYAGFFKAKNSLQPFVIILNQKSNTRDKILKILIKR